MLVGLGTEVDAQTQKGGTALHAAATRRHVEAVKVLLELGADADARNSEGRTPAMHTTNTLIQQLLANHQPKPRPAVPRYHARTPAPLQAM